MDTYDYDANVAPNPRDWLSLSEDERIESVMQSHDEMETESQTRMHAVMHVVVEGQIAMETEMVPQTVDKLVRQGLERHEAIHAIAAILTEDTFDALQGDAKTFDMKKYRRRLDKLTAKRWLKGRY